MTNEALIPVHKAVCQIEGVSDVELCETLVFKKNGVFWEIAHLSPKMSAVPFLMRKEGTAILGFTQPESIKTFFT
jgi:hypothetical protein